ncbi:DUF1694 domain-containing protein [Streptococcus ictaluri]|uniref:DUF1694 domain-containing protein n=1 Tax=Streptococcus ictaluri 707-05 TaxID=764299 RepID=G5K418_9STRE|nr:DUF1694 domain-containing protein [Streptococcus ictaluri]EHI69816.1 hypothetical protein STRIC_1542 [Streptococcus ictaluri 707-05]
MENLDEKLLQAALGEKRFSPDQQRHYLGTFSERMVLSVLLEDGSKSQVMDYISNQIASLKDIYDSLAVKIASHLDSQAQMFYMKLAKEHGLLATIVEEKASTSPFALIIHSNHAVDREETDVSTLLKNMDTLKDPHENARQNSSFWSKLFK